MSQKNEKSSQNGSVRHEQGANHNKKRRLSTTDPYGFHSTHKPLEKSRGWSHCMKKKHHVGNHMKKNKLQSSAVPDLGSYVEPPRVS